MIDSKDLKQAKVIVLSIKKNSYLLKKTDDDKISQDKSPSKILVYFAVQRKWLEIDKDLME